MARPSAGRCARSTGTTTPRSTTRSARVPWTAGKPVVLMRTRSRERASVHGRQPGLALQIAQRRAIGRGHSRVEARHENRLHRNPLRAGRVRPARLACSPATWAIRCWSRFALRSGSICQRRRGRAEHDRHCGRPGAFRQVVFTYSIANFPTLRCLEQIRNDVCYHGANVKMVAVGGGFTYRPAGLHAPWHGGPRRDASACRG